MGASRRLDLGLTVRPGGFAFLDKASPHRGAIGVSEERAGLGRAIPRQPDRR
jgi:hypothetical protein